MSKPKLKPQSPWRPAGKDKRDFRLGYIFDLPKLSEIPATNWRVAEPLEIKNQGSLDFCTAYAAASVAEDHEGVLLDPTYTFAKAKQIEGTSKTWGSDNRTMAKAVTKYGFIEKSQNPFPDRSRDFLADWTNWPESYDAFADKHRQSSFFKVEGPYDLFDNIRAALWKFRGEKHTIVTGSPWYPEWNNPPNGVIPTKYIRNPVNGHAYKLLGQKIIQGTICIEAQNTYGEGWGKGGFCYFTREVVNRELDPNGTLMFIDVDPNDIKVQKISILKHLIRLYQQLLYLVTPKPAPLPEPQPEPPKPTPSAAPTFTQLANAIMKHEGWHEPGTPGFPIGSRSFRNNNPGNLRSPIKGRPSAYLDSLRAFAVDERNFCRFHTPAEGFAALVHFLKDAAAGNLKPYKPNYDLYEFFKKYAPSSDNNNPIEYAQAVAAQLKVPATFKLSDFQRS